MKINLYKIIFGLIVFFAIVVRIYMVEITPMGDSYQIDSDMGNPVTLQDYDNLFDINKYDELHQGHFYNILYIFKNHKIYSNSQGSSYHPPVHYVISAIWMGILEKLNFNSKQMVEGLQYVGIFYFSISIVLINKILNKLEFKEKTKLVIFLLYSFFPKFISIVPLITNDYLVFVFQLLEIILLMEWNKKPNYKNTILFALTYGLGNLVKYNNTVMAVPLAVLFLIKMFENRKSFVEVMNYVIKGIVFLVVAFPISITFILYCVIEEGAYYIAMPRKELYIGDAGFISNWGINLKNLFFLNENSSKNVWIGCLYTTLVQKSEWSKYIFATNFFIIITNIIFFIKSKKIKKIDMKLLMGLFILYFISYIFYNIRFPYACTFESRYMLIVLFISNIFVGDVFEKIENKILKKVYLGFLFLFIITSVVQFF